MAKTPSCGAVEEKGINFDQWLDYEEISYFNLDSGADTLAFSETVALPLERIKETISSYAHRVKEVLSQFRIDFEKYQVPSAESVETAKKIKQMESELAKAQTDGNEKKIQGITKGLEAMKKKDESQKTVALWNKLMGDVSAFDQLKNTIFEAQEKLVKAEEKLNELLSGKSPSGKDVADEKAKLGRAKEDLRGKFEVLDRRIEEFKKNLPELVASALGEGEIGKGRAVSLVQEIESSLAEQFNHYSTDRTTMANLFSERADTEKEKLDKHPMSIFVWARNPDIDLYQGNYSPCCVCIESEYHGAESPIADYITDLGIQIVNIWDENKNEPVTAAWCWLGEDENGEPALVVDNIEANTMFSSNFPSNYPRNYLLI